MKHFIVGLFIAPFLLLALIAALALGGCNRNTKTKTRPHLRAQPFGGSLLVRAG